jgi:hypothetical protein
MRGLPFELLLSTAVYHKGQLQQVKAACLTNRWLNGIIHHNVLNRIDVRLIPILIFIQSYRNQNFIPPQKPQVNGGL